MAVGYVAVEHLYGLVPREASPATMPPANNTQGAGPSKPAVERVVVAPTPVKSPTPSVWPEDRQWGAVDGWSIFETAHIACFARKSFPDDVALVLGRMKGSGDFILGMSGDIPKAEDRTLTLVFDGTRRQQPYFQVNANTVVGRYGEDAGLVGEISRSGGLRVIGEKGRAVTLPLVGTRVALAAVKDCLDAMMPDGSAPTTRRSVFPEIRLCENKPPNGQLLTKRGGVKAQGHKITVRNSAQGDAVVKIRNENTGKLAYSFTVQRNKEATINGVLDGFYRLQFAYGSALGENCVDFIDPQASEFDRAVQFKSQVQRTKQRVTTYTHDFTATLFAVTGGNASTSRIDPASFLKD